MYCAEKDISNFPNLDWVLFSRLLIIEKTAAASTHVHTRDNRLMFESERGDKIPAEYVVGGLFCGGLDT